MPRRTMPVEVEVIATSVADAVAAQRGGATRLEVVTAIDLDGLTPDVDAARRIRDSVTIPMRAMLRCAPNFTVTRPDLDDLCRVAGRLRTAGIDELVFGFLAGDGRLDLGALRQIVAGASPGAWTLHRAFDHARDASEAFGQCRELARLDCILSAGHPEGIAAGLATLGRRAGWQTPDVRWLAGGGLRLEHVGPLARAGITAFHTGRAVRTQGRWDSPVDEARVRALVDVAHAATNGSNGT